jgi:hypothetical protein
MCTLTSIEWRNSQTGKFAESFLEKHQESITLLSGSTEQQKAKKERDILFSKLLGSFSFETDIGAFDGHYGGFLTKDECEKLSQAKERLYKKSLEYELKAAKEKEELRGLFQACEVAESLPALEKAVSRSSAFGKRDEMEEAACKGKEILFERVYQERKSESVGSQEILDALKGIKDVLSPLSVFSWRRWLHLYKIEGLKEVFFQKIFKELSGHENDHRYVGELYQRTEELRGAYSLNDEQGKSSGCLAEVFIDACKKALLECGDNQPKLRGLKNSVHTIVQIRIDELLDELSLKEGLERHLVSLLQNLKGWDEKPLVNLTIPSHDERYPWVSMGELTWASLARYHFFFKARNERLRDILYEYLGVKKVLGCF